VSRGCARSGHNGHVLAQ